MNPSSSYIRTEVSASWVLTPEQAAAQALTAKLTQAHHTERERLMNDAGFNSQMQQLSAVEGIPVSDLFMHIGERLGDPSDPMNDGEYADTPERVLATYRFYHPKQADPVAEREQRSADRAAQRHAQNLERAAYRSEYEAWVEHCKERSMRHALARTLFNGKVARARLDYDQAVLDAKQARDFAITEATEEFRAATADPAPEQPKRQA